MRSIALPHAAGATERASRERDPKFFPRHNDTMKCRRGDKAATALLRRRIFFRSLRHFLVWANLYASPVSSLGDVIALWLRTASPSMSTALRAGSAGLLAPALAFRAKSLTIEVTMPTELLLIVAAFILALRRQTSAPPVIPPVATPNATEDLRFQVSYQQQFISVQASQTSPLDAKYAVLLTLLALLFQYVDSPIENQIVHWTIFALYFIVAAILLGLLAMQRVEVWTEYDP
jgi:hypothetical protein